MFMSVFVISRQYRRHFPNQREILYMLVMSNLNFDTFSKNRIFRSILVISRQYRRHFHNEREIPHILVMSNLNFDKISKIPVFLPHFASIY